MSKVRSKNTNLETIVFLELKSRGLKFKKHVKVLPGKPDIVFPKRKIAVFIDGDFWHGYRFSFWKNTLSLFWQEKIEKNRIRDKKNFAKLRRKGWKVIRIWQHSIKKDIQKAILRILDATKPIV